MDKIGEVLSRGVANVYPTKQALENILRSGKKIRVYQGFDPSMPNLHLGNTVGILKLKQFQELGHKVIFLVGDFTGMIGDPSGKSEARQPMTREQLLINAKAYPQQASKILKFDGPNPAEIKFNSSWLDKLTYAEIIRLTSLVTYAQVVERDMFQKRMKEGKDLFLNELLYPLMQGYDSVAMDIDLEIGGSDQTFNMLMGRTLMKKIKNKEKFVLTTKLLVDAQGNKVGKTAGNALFMNASANDLFGGIMSFPDEVLIDSFELLTQIAMEQINVKKTEINKGKNPMEIKKELAFEIVKMYHGQKEAEKAQEEFERVFQKKEPPTEEIKDYQLTNLQANPVDLLISSGLATSRSEAKRLIEQGAVDVNNNQITNYKLQIALNNGDIIKVGKRKFIRIRVNQ